MHIAESPQEYVRPTYLRMHEFDVGDYTDADTSAHTSTSPRPDSNTGADEPMTTDPFTTAARAEAERIYRSVPGSYLDSMLRMAEWARSYLDAREPTDEEVEAAARVIFNRARAGNVFADQVWVEIRGDYLEDARVRRDAARSALNGYADALDNNRHAAAWGWHDFVRDAREWASENYPEEAAR